MVGNCFEEGEEVGKLEAEEGVGFFPSSGDPENKVCFYKYILK